MPPLAVHAQLTMCSITCALVSVSQIGAVGLTVLHGRAKGAGGEGGDGGRIMVDHAEH